MFVASVPSYKVIKLVELVIPQRRATISLKKSVVPLGIKVRRKKKKYLLDNYLSL